MDLVEEMVVKHEFKKELDKYGVSFFLPFRNLSQSFLRAFKLLILGS